MERITEFEHKLYEWLDQDVVIPQASCLSEIECRDQRHNIRRTVNWLPRAGKPGRVYHALMAWDYGWSTQLCEFCAEAGQRFFQLNREKAWEALPSFFGLPKWADLEDLD